MARFLELFIGSTTNNYLDLLEIKSINHHNWRFQWLTFEPSFSQHDVNACHQFNNLENQETVLWVVDGLIEIVIDSKMKYQLNKMDVIVLTNNCRYKIIVRSAWPTQILSISRDKQIEGSEETTERGEEAEAESDEETEAESDDETNEKSEEAEISSVDKQQTPNQIQTITSADIFPVGNYGIWRSFSNEVRMVLGIDRFNLIVGHSGFRWLGAKYLTEADFRVILCQFPAGKKLSQYPEIGLLPSFVNQGSDDLIFIGLEGYIEVQIENANFEGASFLNQKFHHWITSGKLLILNPGQKIKFEDRGRETIKFLILSPQKLGSLADNLLLEPKVSKILSEIQGPFWSRISWPILKGAGIKFEI